ncbi:MAG TPA: selenocysteine-specific translation elongation factor [Gemmatimonadaceae bacterium]|nr:selenocysteine-specific translation elongation factor [Gemmatimonadaceae bacterium]
MILGTAGHIDHGKTSLVRALTGVDTDRLPEEKRRGITIELGFAPLALDGIGTIGIVDVPGHEGFVRTMVAGATGIDLALLVVAADEGVMPQTREHLAILELLGVRRGVIALTKRDLVDDEWLALVEDDARQASVRALPDAAVIATSSTTGQGIDALREELARLARLLAPRDEADIFRLPVDRAFTIKGTGTVVTGTVWSGRLARDEIVRILPQGGTARVRGIQGHGSHVDAALPGSRSAIALAGVDVDDVPRGSTLVTDGHWRPTEQARADVTLVPDAGVEIRPRAWFRLHVGTSEVGARIVTRESQAGTFSARIVFDQPVVLRAGDRFVVRTSAPLNTIAGGVITDPYAPKRARPWPAGLSAVERLSRLVDEAGGNGVALDELPVRLGASASELRSSIADPRSGAEVVAGRFLVSRDLLQSLDAELQMVVDEYHREHPLEPGAPVQLLRTRLSAAPEVVDSVLQRSLKAGRLTTTSGFVHRTGWSPTLSGDNAEFAGRVLHTLDQSTTEPPSVAELGAALGRDPTGILRYLERRGDVVQVEADRYYAAAHLKSLITRLRSSMAGGAEASPSEIREILGVSRKYLVPLLEYCDRVGSTNRNANGRVWIGT